MTEPEMVVWITRALPFLKMVREHFADPDAWRDLFDTPEQFYRDEESLKTLISEADGSHEQIRDNRLIVEAQEAKE